jgi:hypothetical protein
VRGASIACKDIAQHAATCICVTATDASIKAATFAGLQCGLGPGKLLEHGHTNPPKTAAAVTHEPGVPSCRRPCRSCSSCSWHLWRCTAQQLLMATYDRAAATNLIGS